MSDINKNNFNAVAATNKNSKWNELIKRPSVLYARPDEIRSPFARDYTRILHSMAYRRLKHKTQVFFNIDSDHICTRMEHVAHVESVSSTIAKYLGLNDELTKAIAIGHDLGHAPFGHQGETVIKNLSEQYLKRSFWHEQNGLRFVDKLELLEDYKKYYRNLDLTYAVRDGIISHCGEVDENGLIPRNELIDLNDFKILGQYSPATWEGCVVKIADKIAYTGRDIEDAVSLGFLDEGSKQQLVEMAEANDFKTLNTTVIMHNMIIDICKNSSPDKGICLSERLLKQLDEIKKFNYKYIYNNKRLIPFKKYSELVIEQIFKILLKTYDGKHSWDSFKEMNSYYPQMISHFEKWLAKYCDPNCVPQVLRPCAYQYKNEKIYGSLETKEIYIQAILDFIAGMTDRFAIKMFNELLTY